MNAPLRPAIDSRPLTAPERAQLAELRRAWANAGNEWGQRIGKWLALSRYVDALDAKYMSARAA